MFRFWVKIAVWAFIFGIFWHYINDVIYYLVYSFKFVWSWFDLIFKILWASQFSINALYYVFVVHIILFVYFKIIRKFIY